MPVTACGTGPPVARSRADCPGSPRGAGTGRAQHQDQRQDQHHEGRQRHDSELHWIAGRARGLRAPAGSGFQLALDGLPPALAAPGLLGRAGSS